MSTDLAFIDWIALAFAAVLLAGAAAAAVLALVTSRARTSEPKSGYAHAASKEATKRQAPRPAKTPVGDHARSENLVIDIRDDHRPQHATGPQHLAEPNDEQTMSGSGFIVASDGEEKPAEEPGVELQRAMPLPEVQLSMAGASQSAVATIEHGDDAGASSDEATKLAERAARLRGRPVAESGPATTADESEADQSTSTLVEPPEWEEPTIKKPHRIGFATRGPGFFEDPVGRHELRYWDGARWTEYVKERGERFTDPL